MYTVGIDQCAFPALISIVIIGNHEDQYWYYKLKYICSKSKIFQSKNPVKECHFVQMLYYIIIIIIDITELFLIFMLQIQNIQF